MNHEFRILLVDDEETFLFSTADLLRREGYACDCAGGVDEARELLRLHGHALVIADIKMPGNCELEFVHKLAESAEGISIILATGHPSIASAIQSVELPVVAYLVKPFNFQELLAKVCAASEHASVRSAVRKELARLQEYRQGLLNIEASLGKASQSASRATVQALVGTTLRNIVEGVSALHGLVESTMGNEVMVEMRHWPPGMSGDLRVVLRDAVATLERTKIAFKSKELGELRKRLDALLNA